MSDYPFFDAGNLTDDEILNKLNQLTQRAMVAQMSSRNPQMLDQLYAMIDMLNEERVFRLQQQTVEAWNKMFPDVIESDPDFKGERVEKDANKPAHVVKPAQGQKGNLQAPIFHKEYVNKNKKD